ncbi:hypothetical protein C8R41DRAFT_855714 [Lentinula lateritia]|uniref:Uncharacterized protein n=1 Tax=Lentinula lateritia TaxID=40482 RepID=A0ABQ8V145_9AGAR|nr:hypothetical protein C8R41DRAFT_855714 [Lentinula lateritia]
MHQQPAQHALSHSQSLPQMHLSRYPNQPLRNSLYQSPYTSSAVHSPYHSPQQHPVNLVYAHRSYTAISSAPSEISSTDSPLLSPSLLSPFIPNEQYSHPVPLHHRCARRNRAPSIPSRSGCSLR